MCGICGFTKAEGGDEDHATLKAMCDIMAHRGPDGEGRFIADGIALGHRRLSLIDLEGGGQPMIRRDSGFQSEVFSPAVTFEHARGEAAQASPGAAAPPQAPAWHGRWSIVFNGEIYNYRELRDELHQMGCEFVTDSDTEVLLVGYIIWSKEVLRRLRGMFAFAIYDAETRELFCARDFFGIKPFYYTVQDGQFVFASEIKCILEHPAYRRELNEEALSQYLCFQFSALQETFFKGVYKLLPGYCMLVDADGAIELERYWKPEFHFDEQRSEQATIEAVEHEMRESVRYHNVADVEVGSFLSSGIDSSYLAALLAQQNPDIKTFTVGFSEYEGERNEISWAHELADMLNVENDSHYITESEFWEVLPTVQWHMDEPSADPSAVALYFVDKLAARRVKAVLSGEGADEFFGGYRIYQTPLANAHVDMVPKGLLHAGSKALRAIGMRGANYLERASGQVEEWYYTNANGMAFSPEERDFVLSDRMREQLSHTDQLVGARRAIGLDSQHDVRQASSPSSHHAVGAPSQDGDCAIHESGSSVARVAGSFSPQQLTAPIYAEVADLDQTTRMQYVDLWFWLVGDILLKTDKMSMAHSLESRVPFLDRKVFELAASIPTAQKVTETQTKVTLRQAAERTIPHSWAQKEKLGFPVPLATWLREDSYYDRVKRELTSIEARRFFNTDELQRLLDDHRAGADNSRRIWIVYSFLIWYRVYFAPSA